MRGVFKIEEDWIMEIASHYFTEKEIKGDIKLKNINKAQYD